MGTVNQVILMGNLTRDPASRTIPSGQTVADLGLAVSDNYKDKEGNLVERACFADIVVWGGQAKACAEYLKKGAPVLIEGKLQFDQWKNENGENRSKLRIKAMRVQFLSRASGPKQGENKPTSESEPDDMPF